jgi:hypothetical protein
MMNGEDLHVCMSVYMYGSILTGKVVNGSSNPNGCRGIDTSDSSELARSMPLHELGAHAEAGIVSQDFSTGVSLPCFRR